MKLEVRGMLSGAAYRRKLPRDTRKSIAQQARKTRAANRALGSKNPHYRGLMSDRLYRGK